MNKRGFTLIELLLATAMFSFILLFVTAAFVQVSRAYNKGITVKRTQETARAVVQELTRAIGTATSSSSSTDSVINVNDGAGNKRLCVGGLRYGWNEGFRPNGPPGGREKFSGSGNVDFALVRSTGVCGGPFSQSASVELIDQRLTVRDIKITPVISDSVYNICVVISGNTAGDLTGGSTCDNPPSCNVINGDTYCDVARLETTVTLRR